MSKTRLGDLKTGVVYHYDRTEWEGWLKQTIAFLDACLARGAITKPVRMREVAFVRSTYTAVTWGSEVYALEGPEAGGLVSLNISHPGKSRRCGWGKYVNLYYAYTRHDLRKQGHATALQRFLEPLWLGDGQNRLKSLVGSYGGFRFHRRMGHSFWGTNEKNELVVDAPLMNWDPTKAQVWPDSVPRHARGVTESKTPLTDDVLVAYLQDDNCPYFYSVPEGEGLTILGR